MRVLLADDHDLLRDTLAHYLMGDSCVRMRSVADLDAALEVLQGGERFDLVLLDINMPGMHGLDGLRRVLDAFPAQPVALISGEVPRAQIIEALQMGAAGFVSKAMPAQALAQAIRFMGTGERFAPVDVLLPATGAAPADPPLTALGETLTARERDVLRGLCKGLANKEIARDLGLGESTVKLHIKTLYRRLGVNNRTQAALLARQAGLD